MEKAYYHKLRVSYMLIRKIFSLILFFSILILCRRYSERWTDLKSYQQWQRALHSTTSWWKEDGAKRIPNLEKKFEQEDTAKPVLSAQPIETSAAKKPKGEQLQPSVEPYYTIQLAETKDRQKASFMVNRLHNSGVEAFATPVYRGTEVVFYVRHGLYEGEKLAYKALNQINIPDTYHAKIVALP